MFSYTLPSISNTQTYVTPKGEIKFDPPVYEQRYTSTIHIIEDKCWKQPLKKVVDFGCSEMRLLPLLRRIPHIEHILEVDVDVDILRSYRLKAKPLIADYLKKRENPLRVEVLEGSITDAVEQLYDVDAVICLEIIEHLHEEVLEKVPGNIFGFIQPKLAIFSTPNAEYNVLFGPMLSNGFRHYDHKFEWTRKEFESWGQDICKKYPNYSVCFVGLGKAPPEHENLGYATQMAIFARNDMLNKPLIHEIVRKPTTSEAHYNVIFAVDFPFNEDKRSKEQKVIDEANFYIDQLRNNPNYFNIERCIYQLPWKHILNTEITADCSEAELLEILKTNNFEIEDDFIILREIDNEDYSDDLDYNGEFDLEAQPYKCKLSQEEEEEVSSCLATGCSLINSNVDCDSENDWD